MKTQQERDEIHEDDWNTIRIALECLEFDEEAASAREFEKEVEALYDKLQRMRLI